MARLETVLMLMLLVLQSSRFVCITEGNCPTDEGWVWFDYTSSCYFKTDSSESYDTGKVLCQEKSATITSILSETENRFLHELQAFSSWVYIGLERAANGPWQWHDGQPYEFKRWNGEEPGGNGRACTELRRSDEYWGVFDCDWYNPTICKKSCFNDPDCGAHGTCSTDGGHCVCASKFKGHHCEIFINPSPRARDREHRGIPNSVVEMAKFPYPLKLVSPCRKDEEAPGQQ